MQKDMMYHRRLGDETDDLHFTAAVRTGQWIDFPYLGDALPQVFEGILLGR